tara:strand:+ start:51 stop:431 length:381 start_codon:yes stop_codon:yes gene_type:complete
MLTNGWEFFILNPFENEIKQTTQEKYLEMYNKAYMKLINQLCIPDPDDLLNDSKSTFIYCIDCSENNNDIILDVYYDYTFLKSVFFDKKFKKIKNDINNYYKLYNIQVTNMYKDGTSYYILLKKNS